MILTKQEREYSKAWNNWKQAKDLALNELITTIGYMTDGVYIQWRDKYLEKHPEPKPPGEEGRINGHQSEN